MKTTLHRLFSMGCLLCLCLSSVRCANEEIYSSTGGTGSESGKIPVGTGDDADIPAQLFEILNLDYPGLEKVKQHYEQNEYWMAAFELLAYYRQRATVTHTDISLVGVVPTAGDISWANYALEGRFQSTNTLIPPLSYLNTDGSINWYPSTPTDEEQRWQVHRHKWFTAQAKMWRSTQDPVWIESWKTVYADWVRQNDIDNTEDPNYANISRYAWRGLEIGSRLIEQTKLFFYFLPAEEFTPEWLAFFLTEFHRNLDYIDDGDYTGTGNHLITQAQAETYGGILFPEFRDSGKWIEEGSTNLAEYIAEQTLEDGFQYELDLSYHIGAISDFYLTMDLAVANGRADLFPASYLERMRNMTDIVMNLTYPNYSVPNMNDTRKSSYSRSVLQRNFRNYFRIFPDNTDMQWMAEAGAAGTSPTHLYKGYSSSGYYTMKSGWNTSDIMMVLQNGPAGGWHSQPDNGTFEIYVNGRNFFTDSGVFRYSDGEGDADRNWFRQTRVHNTMTLDYANITGRAGELLKFTEEGSNIILVTQNPSYTGLTHRRAVFFVNHAFFVLVDEGFGTAAGNVNINFNMLGKSDIQGVALAQQPVVLDATNLRVYTTFTNNNNMVVRTFSSDAVTFEQFTGRVSEVYDEYFDRHGWSVNHTKTAGTTSRFITVIVPVTGDASATTISASFTDGGYTPTGASVNVTLNGRTYSLSYTL